MQEKAVLDGQCWTFEIWRVSIMVRKLKGRAMESSRLLRQALIIHEMKWKTHKQQSSCTTFNSNIYFTSLFVLHTCLPSHNQVADAHITHPNMSIDMITPAMKLPLRML